MDKCVVCNIELTHNNKAHSTNRGLNFKMQRGIKIDGIPKYFCMRCFKENVNIIKNDSKNATKEAVETMKKAKEEGRSVEA